MRDKEIDQILKQAADAQPAVDPALLARISQSMGSNLQPVSPLPGSWVLAGGLILICAVVAVSGAILLGPHGIERMSLSAISLIFPVLGILICIAAAVCVAEAIPGKGRPVSPWWLGGFGCVALAAVFGLLFHDYRTEAFVSQGAKCLGAGLAQALPASLGTWFVLRRGFAVNLAAAGFAQGTLAGLAGVTMLELHCANFEAPHLLVWHIAVLPICGAIGTFLALRFVRRDAR